MAAKAKHLSQSSLPTKYGECRIHIFSDSEKKEHAALVFQSKKKNTLPLVRIHSQCLTGDTLGSCKCDCGPQLDSALKKIAKEGGVLLYMMQEGRGIGLANKIKAYALQEKGYDTVEANRMLGFGDDERSYAIAASMLKQLGITKLNVLTNNPKKVRGIEAEGIAVVKRVPLILKSNPHNKGYLEVKAKKMGHMLGSKGSAKPQKMRR